MGLVLFAYQELGGGRREGQDGERLHPARQHTNVYVSFSHYPSLLPKFSSFLNPTSSRKLTQRENYTTYWFILYRTYSSSKGNNCTNISYVGVLVRGMCVMRSPSAESRVRLFDVICRLKDLRRPHLGDTCCGPPLGPCVPLGAPPEGARIFLYVSHPRRLSQV